MRVAFSALLLLLTVPALALEPPIKGSGVRGTETRELAEFNQLASSIAGDVKIVISDPQPLKIVADDNLLPYILTEVTDGKLKIYCEKNIKTVTDIQIELTTRDLDTLVCNGAGDIALTRLKSDKLDLIVCGAGDLDLSDLELDQMKIVLSGSGSIELGGDIKQLEVTVSGAGSMKARGSASSLCATLSGAGDLDLAKLKAASAIVTISGAGDANVNVTDVLVAQISGAGSITYYGKPATVTRSITGSGSIRGK